MIRTVFGHNKSGIALIPIRASEISYINISTRIGDTVVSAPSLSPVNFTPVKNKDFTTDRTGLSTNIINYGFVFSGNLSIKYSKGLNDVYSIWLGFLDKNIVGNGNKDKYSISDLKIFFSQFPNLFSLYINELAGKKDSIQTQLYGDFSQLSNSVERVLIDALDVRTLISGGTYLNLSNYSNQSKLKYFRSNYDDSVLKLIGDLKNLAPLCNHFYIKKVALTSAITYTAGKVWASSFDTLYLPISLTVAENNSLSTDMKNSITSAIGGKSIKIGIINYAYYSNITYLQGLGFAVDYEFTEKLIMPLASNLLDSSTYANHGTMVGTETHSLGGLATSTGNYAYIPNKTSLDFGTGSLRFGCTVKFNAITGAKGIIGKTIAALSVGRYGIYFDSGNLIAVSQITSGNVLNSTPISTYNDGNFHTIEVICNRTTGKQTLTIDGVLINTTSFTPSSDNLAVNARFWIGAYGNSTGTGLLASSELNGIIKDVFVNKF